MADFLIYNKTHWTKEASLGDKATWTQHEVDKFDAVHELDDIIEVRDNGKFGAVNTDIFRVVKRPKLDWKKYKWIEDSVDHTFPHPNGKIYHQYRRRGKVDGSNNIVDKLGVL